MSVAVEPKESGRTAQGLLRRFLLPLLCLGLLLGVLPGCTIRLISDYDEGIDKTAGELQKEMDAFLTSLETGAGSPAATYKANKPFYAKYAVDVRFVMVRAMAHSKNDLSVKQYELMLSSLRELEDSHKGEEGHEDDGAIPPPAIPTYRDLFNQAWEAILRLEVAKKR